MFLPQIGNPTPTPPHSIIFPLISTPNTNSNIELPSCPTIMFLPCPSTKVFFSVANNTNPGPMILVSSFFDFNNPDPMTLFRGLLLRSFLVAIPLFSYLFCNFFKRASWIWFWYLVLNLFNFCVFNFYDFIVLDFLNLFNNLFKENSRIWLLLMFECGKSGGCWKVWKGLERSGKEGRSKSR